MGSLYRLLCFLHLYLKFVTAFLAANESSSFFSVTSDRLDFKVSKVTGDLYDVFFDGVNTLGEYSNTAGRGYLVCYCVNADVLTSSGEYHVGANSTTTYTLIDSFDDTNTHFVAIKLVDNLPTGQSFTYWFIVRDDGSNAIHSWTRMSYHNDTVDFLTTFGEYRYLFRPQTDASAIWTHLSTNELTETPLPSQQDLASEVPVQDSTWVFPGSESAYSKAVGPYFTKYMFADNYDYTHKAHGIYADGSKSNGTAVAAWQLLNTRDTYYGGPTRYDLFVDGSVYNKWSTSHYGARTSNITSGFDRTFGPQALYFNGGTNKSLAELREDAYSKANEQWNAEFYDFLGKNYISTYITSEQRGRFVGKVVAIPEGTVKSQAVLSANGEDYAWNVNNQEAHQHWTDVDLETGAFTIERVAEGTYRLTIRFLGVFGDYIEDDVAVTASEITSRQNITFSGESHGEELWHIGIPDRTAGEFKHGFEVDQNHTSHFQQYRRVWQLYDFPTEFPHGVNYTIGTSTPSVDWNYIHWSSYGPTYNRPSIVYGVNNFTINFHLTSTPSPSDNFTFTILLAGAKGSANPLEFNSTNLLVDWSLAPIELYTYVNDHDHGFRWDIEDWEESSLGVRSGISGFELKKYWSWSGELMREGWNRLVLSIPENSTSGTYVMYDALRLEKA